MYLYRLNLWNKKIIFYDHIESHLKCLIKTNLNYFLKDLTYVDCQNKNV